MRIPKQTMNLTLLFVNAIKQDDEGKLLKIDGKELINIYSTMYRDELENGFENINSNVMKIN